MKGGRLAARFKEGMPRLLYQFMLRLDGVSASFTGGEVSGAGGVARAAAREKGRVRSENRRRRQGIEARPAARSYAETREANRLRMALKRQAPQTTVVDGGHTDSGGGNSGGGPRRSKRSKAEPASPTVPHSRSVKKQSDSE